MYKTPFPSATKYRNTSRVDRVSHGNAPDEDRNVPRTANNILFRFADPSARTRNKEIERKRKIRPLSGQTCHPIRPISRRKHNANITQRRPRFGEAVPRNGGGKLRVNHGGKKGGTVDY